MALTDRPLLLAAADATVRGARGEGGGGGAAALLVLSSAVPLSAITIGAILSTALLVGPPAAAPFRLKWSGTAIALAVDLGVAATLLGIWLAYDSYAWPPGHTWPVSFFVVALIVAVSMSSGAARGA